MIGIVINLESLLEHLFAGLVSKILETDGLRAVVQNDIVGVALSPLLFIFIG